MTDPRMPDEPPEGDSPVEPAAPSAAPDAADSPTQAWPSLNGPADTASSPSGGIAATSPFEPAESLPPTGVGSVGESGTFGAPVAPTTPRRSSNALRWGLAAAGVLIVAVASFAIVSLVGGRPSTSVAMGYMPATTMSYGEVRLDLPGDQRQKLASFLKPFPGFSDQSQIEPKLDEVLDRLVKAATHDKQTWTTDIKPWFGGQLAFGMGVPESVQIGGNSNGAADATLLVATITSRTKAIDWILATGEASTINRTTYGDADLLVAASGGGAFAVGVNDKVMIVGSTVAVKAAIDTGGNGTLSQSDDMKAALGTLEKDYVGFSVIRIRALADSLVRLMATSQPGVLDRTQIDETVLGIVPAWQAQTIRFENDAVVSTSLSPSFSIGYDSTNRAGDLLGHMPKKTLFYSDVHDAGPALKAILDKFRGLEEAKQAFAQFDQAMSLLGGADAAFGWWGDTGVVVAALDDGTIGGGLVIHPRDAAAADRFTTTVGGFIALGAPSSGASIRTEDHNGTKITILDFSASMGSSAGQLPPGYKAELAWATYANVTVLGYGTSFVKAVLDAGPGNSLADDARFKGLLDRVGAQNMGMTFLDVKAIRELVEPLMQKAAPPDQWTRYTTEIQPYLKPIDAIVSSVRKDGGLDRGSFVFTAH